MWNKAFHTCRKCKTKWAWDVWGIRHLNCPECGTRMTDEEVKWSFGKGDDEMTRKPDEIKKALECCFNSAQCADCPYYFTSCDKELVRDAREYIQQLEAERDAAVNCIRGICAHCRHKNVPSIKEPCNSCIMKNCDGWEWRGVQKEECK